MPQKLILQCDLSPGDVVMLTAAVRDLHRCHPKRFLTDVRTRCPELWAHHPHITPIRDGDPRALVLDCRYPLINRCDRTPYHCLHGFIEFLNDRLDLQIRPTEFRGCIRLSAREKSWYSQVHEITRRDIPFWIIAAGGKYDISIKWWETSRYQAVVDHFRGRIQFVQVGSKGHHHPRLNGVIDLRGQTDLRQLIRLVYHAQGVLCPVTSLMHLAAAVPLKNDGRQVPALRPCVVIAGGREPAHWEAYPGHQFIHTQGALPCCQNHGCWRDRVTPLGDGDRRDEPEHLCARITNRLPQCMDMISAVEVIRRIESYFAGGVCRYLTPAQHPAARRGIQATANNDFDAQPLNLHNARMACEGFLTQIPPRPRHLSGRGIVICGGGLKYFPSAWVCINRLRDLGCRLPIQLWHLGRQEVDGLMEALLAPLGVECMDAQKWRKKHPVRRLGGWELKPYAILHSPFAELLFLDADNVPVRNPEYLFTSPAYRKTSAVFWPDRGRDARADAIWRSCDLRRPDGPEFESGQILLDKQRAWPALCLSLWFNEHSDFYYRHLHGDKETFHLAFEKLRQPYALVPHPVRSLGRTLCQQDFAGQRLFQHRGGAKWKLLGANATVPDFWYEEECLRHVARLRQLWPRPSPVLKAALAPGRP